MKYMTAILALGTVAFAAPAEVEKRKNTCSNTSTSVCCNGVFLALGLCPIVQLGATCPGGTSYCCKNGASTDGFININAANCVKLG